MVRHRVLYGQRRILYGQHRMLYGPPRILYDRCHILDGPVRIRVHNCRPWKRGRRVSACSGRAYHTHRAKSVPSPSVCGPLEVAEDMRMMLAPRFSPVLAAAASDEFAPALLGAELLANGPVQRPGTAAASAPRCSFSCRNDTLFSCRRRPSR